MQGILESALANPWGALRAVLDEPLHPGGRAATESLLDRATVDADTRLLDVGCGAGEAMAVATERDADVLGVDRDPAVPAADTGGSEHAATPRAGTVRGDMTRLPIAPASVDVVLGECVFCLAPDYSRALSEARRVLRPGGRLALSDVVVEGALPDLPEPVVRALCLQSARSRSATVDAVTDAGFSVTAVRDHREDLLTMRDRVGSTVDYERLLPLMGETGERLLAGIEALETAAETGRVSYVSLVATVAD